MDIDKSRVNKLLELDIEKLLEIIGEEDGALYAAPPDKKNRGLRRVRNSIARIRNTICTNKFLETYCGDNRTQERVAAVAAIADLLGGGGAVAVAVLIVHVGIENICNDTWEAKLG